VAQDGISCAKRSTKFRKPHTDRNFTGEARECGRAHARFGALQSLTREIRDPEGVHVPESKMVRGMIELPREFFKDS